MVFLGRAWCKIGHLIYITLNEQQLKASRKDAKAPSFFQNYDSLRLSGFA
jgi:hypothetical protein